MSFADLENQVAEAFADVQTLTASHSPGYFRTDASLVRVVVRSRTRERWRATEWRLLVDLARGV